ncbi:chloride channel [Cladochytrium replicatum]|nr:chloride channel [Cladochytrium replicatum]
MVRWTCAVTNSSQRIVGAFGIVASGLYSGIDGPFAQIGASVCIIGITGILQSHFLRRMFFGEAKKEVYSTPNFFQRIFGHSSTHGDDDDNEITDEDRARLASNFGWDALLDFLKARRIRTFATVGAATAITAIFRSPLGGVVFALEEAASYFEPPLLVKTLMATIVSYFLVAYNINNFKESLEGVTGAEYDSIKTHFDSTHAAQFAADATCQPKIPLDDLYIYTAIGVLAAIVGRSWNHSLSLVQKARLKYVMRVDRTLSPSRLSNRLPFLDPEFRKKWGTPLNRLLEVFAVCVITSVVVVLLPVIPNADTCVSVRRPLQHVLAASPEACFLDGQVNLVSGEGLEGTKDSLKKRDLRRLAKLYGRAESGSLVTVSSLSQADRSFVLSKCLSQVPSTVCLPDDLMSDYITKISSAFMMASNTSASTASSKRLTMRNEENPIAVVVASAATEPGHDSSSGSTAPAGGSNSTTGGGGENSTAGNHDSTTGGSSTSWDSSPGGGHSSPGGTSHGDALAEAVAREDLLLNLTARQKLLPYYDFRTDKLFGLPKTKHGASTSEHRLVVRASDPNSEALQATGLDQACYFELRSLLFQSPENQLKLILKRGAYNIWSARTLAIFMAIYIFLSLLTWYIALPTDVVIPNLIIGAVKGRLIGLAINYFKARSGQQLQDPGFWALLGMAGSWSASTRTIITVIVISLEMTNDFNALPGLLMVTFIAAGISARFGPSLYHTELENNGAPFLEQEPPYSLHTRSIEHAMSRKYVSGLYQKETALDEALRVRTRAAFEPAGSTGPTSVLWLRKYEPLDKIHQALATAFDSFPVVNPTVVIDDESEPANPMARVHLVPVGIVTRTALKHAMERLHTHIEGDIELREAEMFPVLDVMNPSPTVVKRDTVASKVFRMVRMLGLRQVLVVDDEGKLLGVATRKDLVRLTEALHHVHGEMGRRRRHGKRSGKGSSDEH